MSFFEKKIFYPKENHPILSETWKDAGITLKFNDQTLTGWLVKNERLSSKESQLIIYYGGNAEDISLNLDYLWKINAGYFLLMNYRGYGNSSGSPTKKDLLNDALEIYDYMVKTYHLNSANIFLLGRSLGASVASYVASRRDVGGLILVTPFDSIQNLVKHTLPWLPISWVFKNSFNTLEYLANVKNKFLILAAEKEEIVPKECFQSIVSTYKSNASVTVVKDADHQDISEYSEYYTAINQYLSVSS